MKDGTETVRVDFCVLGWCWRRPGLALGGHDGSADPHGRRGHGHIDVALADREHLADAGGHAEHDLDDLLQLAVRRRTGEPRTATPTVHRHADSVELLDRERLGLGRRLLQPDGVAAVV